MILIWLNSTVALCCVEGVLSFIVQVHFCRLNLLVLFIICQMDFLFRRSGETESTVS